MRPSPAVLACILVMAFPGRAQSQGCHVAMSPDSIEALAETYMPILKFGPGELRYPTIPFFAAFDTFEVAGTGNPLKDLSRIAQPNADGKLSWETLDYQYSKRIEAASGDPPRFPLLSAVFYRIRCLNRHDLSTMWTFLQNDPQAWRRSGLDQLYERGLKAAEFVSVEYYMYYVRDRGLQGHPQDTEKFFVFVPVFSPRDDVPSSEAALLDANLVKRMRMYVGAGHSATTANNVLVLIDDQIRKFRFPEVLIELGGHSSAADYNRDGRFSRGMDVNWNVDDKLWGTRDVQAIAGSGFLGSYQEWMTMPRDTSWSVVLRPTSPATALRLQRDSLANEAKRLELTAGGVDQAQRQAIEAEISERERAYEDRVKQIKSDSSSRDLEYKQTITLPSAAPIAETPAPGAAAPPSLPSAAEVELRKQGRYVLLPVAPFQALSVLVDSFTRAAKPSIEPYGVADASNLGPQQVAAESGVELRVRLRGRIVALVDSIQQLLQYQYGFRGFQELTEAEIDGVIDRMRYWNMDMVSANNGTIGAYRGQVWRDREFRSRPSAIFKRYLYRPSTNAIRNLGDGLNLLTFNHVVSFGTEGSNEVMVGAVLPTVRSSLSIPGVIEMQVGLARKNFWSVPEAENFALAFTYDRHYKATIAWYSRLSWVNNRRSIEGDNDASNLGLGLGASIMPFWPFSDKVHGISKRLKTRVGVRIDWRDVQPNLHRLELQTTFYYR